MELSGILGEALRPSDRMPVVFIGHGSPMNAIDDTTYAESWKELGRTLPEPQAILVVSAHWVTQSVTMTTGVSHPKTIHDFYGFPPELFEVEYPAPGLPALASGALGLIGPAVRSKVDTAWGLDHGTWSVLRRMYPSAQIPVVQLSLDYDLPMAEHYAIGTQLRKLRELGVLIVGSGNVVHNLRAMRMGAGPRDWALEFEAMVRHALEHGADRTLIDFQRNEALAMHAHPTYEHYLPLLYTLGARESVEPVRLFNGGVVLGAVSMLCAVWS